MTNVSSASDQELLLEHGNAALQGGNTIEARKYFRQAVDVGPENPDAWMGLALAVLPYQDKRDHLQRVLELDPTYAEAQAMLQEVEAKLTSGAVFAPPYKPPKSTIVADDSPEALQASEEQATDVHYCYRHPERETGLQCTQCGTYICAACARSALVGQLCPDCARERRPPNYQVSVGNIVVAALLSLVTSVVMSFLVVVFIGGFVGFFGLIIALLLGPAVARLIVRLIDYATRAKRGKAMQLAVGISFVVGAFPLLFLSQSLVLLLFTLVTTSVSVALLR